MKDIHDVIKHAKFGDDRLRGSGVVASQILAFPIDFAGRPYNTLTLPCERVIGVLTADEVDLGGRVVVVHLHIDGVDTDSARAEDRAEQTERN